MESTSLLALLLSSHPPNFRALLGTLSDQSLTRHACRPLIAQREFVQHPRSCNAASSCVRLNFNCYLSFTCWMQAKTGKKNVLRSRFLAKKPVKLRRETTWQILYPRKVCFHSSPAGEALRACAEKHPRVTGTEFFWYLLWLLYLRLSNKKGRTALRQVKVSAASSTLA